MTETAEKYNARLATYVDGKDAIALQRQAPLTIAALLRGFSNAK
jgi:hypothetical protein